MWPVTWLFLVRSLQHCPRDLPMPWQSLIAEPHQAMKAGCVTDRSSVQRSGFYENALVAKVQFNRSILWTQMWQVWNYRLLYWLFLTLSWLIVTPCSDWPVLELKDSDPRERRSRLRLLRAGSWGQPGKQGLKRGRMALHGSSGRHFRQTVLSMTCLSLCPLLFCCCSSFVVLWAKFYSFSRVCFQWTSWKSPLIPRLYSSSVTSCYWRGIVTHVAFKCSQ